ncbi:HAMP domain-containing sensor histidine kinase [Paenibacillus kandeliae]|uniref:HAMP domain-containing sensor histidine kinase n=1 Tax=Paenibacillus kandeliae TaxID=3231269 RepID=UPI003459D173
MLLSTFFSQKQASTSLPITDIVRATSWKEGTVQVDAAALQAAAAQGLWLQILDEDGNEIFGFQRPASIPAKYTPGLLVSNYMYPAKSGYHLSTWYASLDNRQLTWILGERIQNENWMFLVANNLWIVFMIVSGCIIAVYFGKRFGAPLLHVVSWIENLAAGVYQEPRNKKNQVNSRSARGRLKSGFKTYTELLQALEALTDTLKKNKTEREKLEQTREEWMTGVSHDLKTPLSVVKGYAVLLASPDHHWESDQVRSFSDKMQHRIEYMEYLIEDFNLSFRLQNNGFVFRKEKVELVEVLRETTIALTSLEEAKQKHFEFEHKPAHIEVEGDENYLKRAFENIIMNCIKHNPADTRIHIRIYTDEQHAVVDIADDGIGMNEEEQERLFERYYRGANTADSSGTGLGMAIAREIVLAHQGHIEVTSAIGKGTRFEIRFPIWKP